MRDRINAALQAAISAEDEPRICMLRLILTAIRDREDQAPNVEQGELPPEDIRALLVTMVRQREEAVRDYEESGRLEMAESEQEEIAILKEFLPKPLNQKELQTAIAHAIRETGASSIRDMGKVMSALKAHHSGQIDFSAVGRDVKAALG